MRQQQPAAAQEEGSRKKKKERRSETASAIYYWTVALLYYRKQQQQPAGSVPPHIGKKSTAVACAVRKNALKLVKTAVATAQSARPQLPLGLTGIQLLMDVLA